MSSIEIFLVALVVILLMLVARLLQQNKLLRAEVLRLELLPAPIEKQDKGHYSDEISGSADQEGTDDEEAELVLKSRLLCEIAASSASNLEDEHERDRFNNNLKKAESVALSISDPFYCGAALHEIIILHAKVGHEQKVHELLERIEDDFIRSKTKAELAGLRSAT